MHWTVDELSRNVHTVSIDSDYRRSGWEYWALCISDVHFDSVSCDRNLLFRHMEEARQKNAPVFVCGDMFDVMQGKFDPRRHLLLVRPEYVPGDKTKKIPYYDAVVDDSVAKLEKYADLFTVFGYGNHESSVAKNADHDMLRRFSQQLNLKGGNTHVGGYGGYVFWRFGTGDGPSVSVIMKYFHGSGGGAPVTLGTIQGQRMFARYGMADMIVTGHVHNKWETTRTREMVTFAGKVFKKDVLVICTASYADHYDDGAEGWEVERGADPKPMGGYWLRFTSERTGGKGHETWVIKCAALAAT